MLARTLYVLALAGWIGASFFFSMVVLPTLFINMESAEAGAVAALLFPGYYYYGLACAAVLLAACAFLAHRVGRGWRAALAVAVVMIACQAYAAGVILPRMAEIRGIQPERVEFDDLHRLSVRLNAVVLIGGLALLLAAPKMVEEA